MLLVVEALARLGRGQYRGLAGPDQLFGAAHRGGGIHGEAQPGKGPARRIGDWIEITGVGFFDFEHSQCGVAPNAIELHPVLAVRRVAN